MNSLNAIENGLHALGREKALQNLQPGLKTEEITAVLNAHNLRPVEGILDLFSWHNGIAPTSTLNIGELSLIPGFYLLTLEEAIATSADFAENPLWQPDWLPILADDGGDFYVVATDGVGEVKHFMVDESHTPVLASSLPEYLEKIAECFETGIFFVDADSQFEMDDAAYTHIFSDY